MNKITIRTLDKNLMLKHIDDIMRLDRLADDANWTEENFLLDLPRKWELSLIAYHHNPETHDLFDKVVGYLIASEIICNKVYIHRLATYPREQGIGTRLLNQLDGTLICQPKHKKIIDFYLGSGFEITNYVLERI